MAIALTWHVAHASGHKHSSFNLLNRISYSTNTDGDMSFCDKRFDAHCVRFDGKALKDNMCKLVRLDSTFNDIRFASISCTDNYDSYVIQKEDIGQGEQQIKPGTTLTDTYSQCNNFDCVESKVIGIDSYTINADKTSTPYETTIPIDVTYGKTYNKSLLVDDVNLADIISDDSCTEINDPAKTKLLYCAGLNSKSKKNKYVKITNLNANSRMTGSMIFCASPQTHYGYVFRDTDDSNLTFGSESFTVSQCDDFACKNPKLVGKDTVTLLPNKTVDHTSNSFTIDPAYGEDCTSFNK